MEREFTYEQVLDGYELPWLWPLDTACKQAAVLAKHENDIVSDIVKVLEDELMRTKDTFSYYTLPSEQDLFDIIGDVFASEDFDLFDLLEIDNDFRHLNMYGAGELLDEAADRIVSFVEFDEESTAEAIAPSCDAIAAGVPFDDVDEFEYIPLMENVNRTYGGLDGDIADFTDAIYNGDSDTAEYIFRNVFSGYLQSYIHGTARDAVSKAYTRIPSVVEPYVCEVEADMIQYPQCYLFRSSDRDYEVCLIA